MKGKTLQIMEHTIILLTSHLLKSINGKKKLSHSDPFLSQEDDPVDSKASTPPARDVDSR